MPWLEDIQYALEAWIVFALIFCLLPKLIFPEGPGRGVLLRFFGRFARMVLLTTAGVSILSFFHILNALTLAGFYGLLLLMWASRIGISRFREWILGAIGKAEEWYKRQGWKTAFQFKRQLIISPKAANSIPVLVAWTIVVLLVAEMRFWWPLHDLRFAYPDAYNQLLNVRELLHETGVFSRPTVLTACLGVVTSLGAVDAMQTIRFLSPFLDILLAIGGGVAMATIFRNNWVGAFTAFIFGCYSQRSIVSEGTVGFFFLLLGCGLLADCFYYSHRASLYDSACSFALFAFSLPEAFAREIVLPLFLICVLGLIAQLLRRSAPGRRLDAVVPSILMIGIFVIVPPTYPSPHFVEYDATARQSLRIASTLPEMRWTIVAPAEQFSETFGRGHYLDLAEFVSYYGNRVSDSNFRFPYQTVFVFVEKHPFQYFANEPTAVSFATLTDPTYRNYRSPAGRSSLELATAKLCSDYANRHPSQVYYEDDELRIYEFNRNTFARGGATQ